MIFGSVCSGVETASLAWQPLGWKTAYVAEIDRFACAVLDHRFPGIPNLGDFTGITNAQGEGIDLLVGGTPCQDFSIIGNRAGLAGDRGKLTLAFVGLADRLRPRWLVWENVRGVLSAGRGSAFAAFRALLAECGYRSAWRVLDAQLAGVPQQRRRVFLVGFLGDWRPAAAVLFDPESLSGNPAPRHAEAGHTVGTITSRPRGSGGLGTAFDLTGGLLPVAKSLVAGTSPKHDPTVQTLIPIAFSTKDSGADAGLVSPTLRSGNHDKSHANAGVMPAVAGSFGVRRLTPRECERLQGMPDDHTLVPNYTHKFKAEEAAQMARYLGLDLDEGGRLYATPDGPRYRAIGNAKAVPVVRRLGERIAIVDRLLREAGRVAA